MSTCRSCSAPIRWVRLHPKLGAHPLDPQRTATGNILVDDDDSARVLTGTVRQALLDRGILLYTSHFATCAHAAQHRKPKA